MAKRDVDLVLRAKNTANAAVKSLADLLKELKVSQDEAGKSAGKADTLFGELSQSLTQLTKAAAGLEQVGQISEQFKKAGSAVEKLDSELAKAREELTKTATAAKAFKDSSEALAKAAADAKAKLDQERATLIEIKEAQKFYNVAVKEADALLKVFANDVSKLTVPNQKLVEQYREQRAQFGALKQAQTDVNARYEATVVSVNKLEAAYKGEKAAATEADKAARNSAEATKVTEQNFERLNATVVKAKDDYGQISAALKTAAETMGLASTESNHLATAQERLATLTRETTAAMKVQAATKPIVAAVGKYGVGGPAADATAAFRNQAAAVQSASAVLQNSKGILQDLYKTQASLAAPTIENTAAINAQRAAVEAADIAYEKELATFRQLKGVIQEQVKIRKEAAAATEQLDAATRAEAEAENLAYNSAIRARSVERERVATARQSVGTLQEISGALRAQAIETGHAATGFRDLVTQLKYAAIAYIGFYQAAHQVAEVIKVSTDYEAAQQRITTALGGDLQTGANAFNHAADAARRLKLDILPAVDAYGLFLASLKGTKLEGETAVKLFDDVLVAIRAFKLGPDAMSRTILALKDMATRGNIARKEMNQLDQALPVGLFVELGKAAGYSKNQLAAFSKEVHAGRVGLDILLPAFESIRLRAEKGLPQALKTAQSSFADLRNAILDARLAVAQSGFLDAVSDAAKKLAETFRSQEGINGLKALGNALAGVTRILTFFVEHAEAAIFVIGALGGPKLLSMIVSFRTISTVLSVLAIRVIPAIAAALSTLTLGFVSAAGAGAALTGLVETLLGPVGIAIAVASIAGGFLLWQTHISTAEENLTAYNRILKAVGEAQATVAGTAKAWADSIKDLTLTEVETSVRKYRDLLSDLNDKIKDFGKNLEKQVEFGRMARTANVDEYNALRALVDLYDPASMSLKTFADSIELMNKGFRDETVKKAAADLADMARKAADTQGKLGDVSQVAIDMKSKLEGLTDAAKTQSGVLEKLTMDTGDLGNGFDEDGNKLDKFGEAMDRLKSHIPALAAELKKLKEEAQIDADLQSAINAARQGVLGDYKNKESAIAAALGLADQARATLDAGKLTAALQGLTTVSEKAAKTIVNFEGAMQGKAFWDTNRYRVGFSSDTKTDEQGRVTSVTKDSTSTMAEAVRDLARRIAESLNQIEKSIGSDNFRALSDEQKAVLASIAYNFGELPKSVADAIKSGGSDSQVADVIRRLIPQNGPRRATEAAVYQNTSDPSANQVVKGVKAIETEQAKEKKNQEDINTSVQATIDLLNSVVKGKEESNKQGFIEKTVQEQVNAAKKKGVELTKEQITGLRTAAAANYDVNHPNEDLNAKKKEVNDLIKQLKGLQDQRSTAIKELDFALSQGDSAGVDAAKQKVADLTAQLKEAVPKALELAKALGDEKMVANLGKIDLQTAKVNVTVNKMAVDINTLLVDQLSTAFNTFFDAIAAGEKPMQALKKAFLQFAVDFLKSIAQMILKQLLFNLVTAGGGAAGGAGGILGGLLGSIGVTGAVAHGGGIVGQPTGSSRTLPASMFAQAQRFHGGGFPGLSPGEVPIVARRREEILAASDPRNALNGGAGGSKGPSSLHVVNVFDPADLLDKAFRSTVGQRTYLNWVSDNRAAFKAALG